MIGLIEAAVARAAGTLKVASDSAVGVDLDNDALGLEGVRVVDLFSGTSRVGQALKRRGCVVCANDNKWAYTAGRYRLALIDKNSSSDKLFSRSSLTT